jgi:hypothetical protein
MNSALGTFTNWRYNNLFFSCAVDGGRQGASVGLASTDAGTYDQIFVYHNCYSLGTTEVSGTSQTPVNAVSNSIFWLERNTWRQGQHNHTFYNYWNKVNLNQATMHAQTTVFGSPNLNGDNGAVTNTGGGGNPPSLTQWNISGNVNLCGYNGIGSSNLNWLTSSGTTLPAGVLAIYAQNNSACTGITNATNFTSPSNTKLSAGAFLGEKDNFPTGANAAYKSIDSNLFFRLGAAGPIAEACDSTAGIQAGSIAYLGYNAVVNTTATYLPAICVSSAAWTVTGPLNDQLILNRAPVMVDAYRTVPLFDVNYLIPAGLMRADYYTSDPNWQGAWTTGPSGHGDGKYHVGDVVSLADPSAWNSTTTYWRCIATHTPTSALKPLVGQDPANPYAGYAPYWELAYLKWFRNAVQTAQIFSDGAVRPLTDVNGNLEAMYAIGLLNAWLRQGFVTMEPTIWGSCSHDQGATLTECGAVPLAPIQHIPPPAAVN